MEYELSEGEAEDYVCDGAELSCPHLIGTNLPIILKVYDKSITFMRDKPIATEKDNKTENFYFDLDEMPRSECELGGKCYITGGYWKEETLSQNVYCNGNRAVLMKSKFCCDKDYSNILSIEKMDKIIVNFGENLMILLNIVVKMHTLLNLWKEFQIYKQEIQNLELH